MKCNFDDDWWSAILIWLMKCNFDDDWWSAILMMIDEVQFWWWLMKCNFDDSWWSAILNIFYNNESRQDFPLVWATRMRMNHITEIRFCWKHMTFTADHFIFVKWFRQQVPVPTRYLRFAKKTDALFGPTVYMYLCPLVSSYIRSCFTSYLLTALSTLFSLWLQTKEAGDGDWSVYRVHAARGGHPGGLDPHQEVPCRPEKTRPMTPVEMTTFVVIWGVPDPWRFGTNRDQCKTICAYLLGSFLLPVKRQ